MGCLPLTRWSALDVLMFKRCSLTQLTDSSVHSRASPQGVSLVKVEEHVVQPELGLPRAVDLALRQVLVHLLQALQALGQVLVVDLGLERPHALLAQLVGAVHVEACALLDQRHRLGAAEVLLDDVL